MKIESLYEYIVLTHYLNFTTAASTLHTSQPNLSKHILELEQELDVELLRRGKQLELTPAGTAFLEDAIQIHHLYKDALTRVREIASHEMVELIVQEPYVMDAMSEILFKSVTRFKRENPYVTTKYSHEKNKKSVELLEQGKIDIALTVDCNNNEWIEYVSEKKNLIFYPVIQEQLHVWMWKDHPLARRDTITLPDLLDTPINMTATRCFDPMRYAILDLFKKSLGTRPDLQALSYDSLNEFFMSTHDRSKIFLVSESMTKSQLLLMHHDMISVPINDPRARITSYLLLRNDYGKPAIDQLLDTIEQVVAESVVQSETATYLQDIKNPY